MSSQAEEEEIEESSDRGGKGEIERREERGKDTSGQT